MTIYINDEKYNHCSLESIIIKDYCFNVIYLTNLSLFNALRVHLLDYFMCINGVVLNK